MVYEDVAILLNKNYFRYNGIVVKVVSKVGCEGGEGDRRGVLDLPLLGVLDLALIYIIIF